MTARSKMENTSVFVYSWQLVLYVLAMLAIQACGGGSSSPAGAPGSQSASSSAELWVQANAVAIESLTLDSNFSDLVPIANAIGRARVVQLGESSHGSGSMSQLKTRLIKYLHQQHGFNVIAFESSLFACSRGLEQQPQTTADFLIVSCVFGVWQTEEVLELFRYILQTQKSSQPLRLVGFDVQISGNENQASIESFFQQALPMLTAEQRQQVISVALAVHQVNLYGTACFKNNQIACEKIKQSHPQLQLQLQQLIPLLDGQTSIVAQLAYLQLQSYRQALDLQLAEANKVESKIGARDVGMAANVSGLLQTLLPTEKMLIWAHNVHISEDYPWQKLRDNQEKVMGMHLHQQWRDELYSIGLFMLSGSQADNDRSITTVTAHRAGSLESLFMPLKYPVSFLALPKQNQSGSGDDWLHQATVYKEWGRIEQQAVLSQTFDAVLMIANNQPPRYLTAL
ncbi:MAG: erythromycin esterase family protein [Gammaproteobacteria bacterium]|nr:erythromycin esterase family protein [Gammaproteobacteria bacterium]MBU2180371.1 erythromycin esterase family protein [Gammaproteobacteria bacterium]MBU2222459.1 erythromycin esterase family protein [Gammaproteobacteria bacterium]MBU2277300.1 erythromycin esterase family protein [Gammaproteobacteria bacterium]MBU2428363.1 erythromycin esterase family protein [Gammaproteobacteria bacterium]